MNNGISLLLYVIKVHNNMKKQQNIIHYVMNNIMKIQAIVIINYNNMIQQLKIMKNVKIIKKQLIIIKAQGIMIYIKYILRNDE